MDTPTQGLEITAAALQPLVRSDMLQALLRAKAESDRRNYRDKQEILRRLLRSNPDEFVIDSETDNGRIVGLTHTPTRFKIHTPTRSLPGELTLPRVFQRYTETS